MGALVHRRAVWCRGHHCRRGGALEPASPSCCAAQRTSRAFLMSDHAPGCGRCARRPDPRNGSHATSFPAAAAASSRDNKSLSSRPALRCGPYGCGSAVPGLRIAIKAAMVAGLETATRRLPWLRSAPSPAAKTASYTGTIKTLSLNIKARLVPAEPVDQRQGPGPAGAGRQRRDRGRVAPDLEGEHRVSLGQARRSVLPGADLRQPLQGETATRSSGRADRPLPRRLASREPSRLFSSGLCGAPAIPKSAEKPALRPHHSA